MVHQPIKVGNYVNFTVQRVVTDPCGARSYVQEKYTGQVTSMTQRELGTSYKVRVRNSKEYHEVLRFKITHVWHIV